jgi:thioredoxin reductase (NADPH)
LWEQASVFEKELLLSQKVTALDIKSDYITLRCESGLEVHSKTVLVTGGIGSFSPRPLPTGMQWLGKGLVHFVPDFSQHAGKDVVIVGGGDSAFDWALSLQPIAKSVTVVHRREEFRAHAATVEKVKSIGVRLITSAEIAEVSGDEVVSQVAIKVGEKLEILPCQTLVAALGFVANIGTMENWGFEVEKRRIKVGTYMESTLPRVFAAGDLATYPGKVPLISVGFGEAATAVNNAAPYIHQGESVFPKHSSGGD